ncbi:MAG: hypothetical protein KDD62_15850, partial [Bdellovibrionales bacterium]|nr:hypothetical protein [Bdellovibrionales bacterium]
MNGQSKKNIQLIVFGDDWGRHPSSSQHLIKELVSWYDVIWVNSVGMRAPKIRLKDFKRVWQKVTNCLFRPSEHTPEG